MTAKTAHILISRTCVNNCIFCTVATRRNEGIFPNKEDIIRFIKEAASSNVTHFTFSGMGEPTLDPNFEEYLELASNLKFPQISLFTNGYGLTDEKVRRWKNMGITRILLSMHGFKESHDRNVQREGSFNEAINALELYNRHGIGVTVNSCLTRLNIDDMPKLSNFLKEFKVIMHTLAFPEYSGNMWQFKDHMLDYEEVIDAADTLIPEDDTITYFENIPYCLVRKKTLELQGQGLVRLLDGTGEKEFHPTSRKPFLGSCSLRKCPLLDNCSGFEKGYIKIRGWQDLPGRVDSFLDELDNSKTREKILPAMISRSRPRESNRREKPMPEDNRRDSLVVIVKPTMQCNAGCRYCSSQKKSFPPNMTSGLRDRIYAEIFEYAETVGKKSLTFLWHGGEPMLLGKGFYADAFKQTPSNREIRIKHLIQTNLLLLDNEWVELLQKHDVHISSSVDPIGQDRILKDGSLQYPVWLDKFLLACTHNLKIGIVFTVTPNHVAKVGDIYNFFKNLQTLSSKGVSVRINPVYPAGAASELDSTDLIDPISYGKFLCELWELWNKDESPFSISPMQSWLDGKGMSCEFSGHCNENFIAVDGVGGIYHCGRFSDFNMPWGNILTDKLADVLKHPQRMEISKRSDKLKSGLCRECNYWDLCKGGCPGQAQLIHGDVTQKTPFCSSYKYLFENSGIGVSLVEERNN